MVEYVDKKQLYRVGQNIVTVQRTSVHNNKVDITLKKKIYESQTRKFEQQKIVNLKNMTNVLSDDDTDTTSRVSFLKKKENNNILD